MLYITHDKVVYGTFILRQVFVSCHAVFEQYLEVIPLHGTCVLELINHDMLEVCPDLFIDERSDVGILLYHLAKHHLSVGEHKARILLVKFIHFLTDAEQQAHLIDVLQGDDGRAYFRYFCLTFLLNTCEVWD